uniref:Ig-like domain-containing protein n=1 Tax=Oncorhynchus tshawytscha TaxID=74940 RepID=A0A8C8IZU9_ONCTS
MFSLMLIFFSFTGETLEKDITPTSPEDTEGKPVILRCSYDASRNYPLLYWYRHYDYQAPHFLLYKGARSSTREHIPDKRYTSKTSQTTTELIITHLTLADTALYYCALIDCYYENCYTQ